MQFSRLVQHLNSAKVCTQSTFEPLCTQPSCTQFTSGPGIGNLQMSTAPLLGGGFGHFFHYAPVRIEYAIDRFAMEV